MGLDSAIFLFFLAIVALMQAGLPGRGRVIVLLAASVCFYAAASVNYLILLLVLCSLNYWAVLGLSRLAGPRLRTWVFGGAVLINLLVLIAFKYAGTLIGQLLAYCGWHGSGVAPLHLATPLGLSYFTFQMLACVTDVYRGNWKLESGFFRVILFGFFFPQISSGPIPRAERLWPQLSSGGLPTTEDRLAGLRLITYGFFKKYVVANRLTSYIRFLDVCNG